MKQILRERNYLERVGRDLKIFRDLKKRGIVNKKIVLMLVG
jgi:hypothetical protein